MNIIYLRISTNEKRQDLDQQLKAILEKHQLKDYIVYKDEASAYQLDKIHLDHGELNKINNHVFVSLNKFNNVHIIDFESSSMDRRPSNVTSVTQALLLYGSLAKTIKQYLSISSHDIIINSLQIYKKKQSEENFLDLLSIIIKDKS